MTNFDTIDRNELLEIAAVELPKACEKLLAGKGEHLTERERLLVAACMMREVTTPEAQSTANKNAKL